MTLRRSIMKRELVHAVTAIVTLSISFAIGVFISPIGFSLDMMGHGKMLNGGGGFFIQRYTSTYWIKLWFSSGKYQSPEKANEDFASNARSAVKVIDCGPKYNRHGDKIGQRAVALMLNPETNEQYASVFWTDGPFLRSIDSWSMTHVLQFERYRAPRGCWIRRSDRFETSPQLGSACLVFSGFNAVLEILVVWSSHSRGAKRTLQGTPLFHPRCRRSCSLPDDRI
jgi:hypothetical protein